MGRGVNNRVTLWSEGGERSVHDAERVFFVNASTYGTHEKLLEYTGVGAEEIGSTLWVNPDAIQAMKITPQ